MASFRRFHHMFLDMTLLSYLMFIGQTQKYEQYEDTENEEETTNKQKTNMIRQGTNTKMQ